MDSFITFFLEKAPTIAIVMLAFTLGIIAAWWAGKFYHKVKHTESEVAEVKTELRGSTSKMEAQIAECATKTDLKDEMETLRTNHKAEIKEQISECATKTDLEVLRTATKMDLEVLRTATKTDLEVLRTATKTDLEVLRTATKTDLEVLRTESKADLKTEIRTLKENDLFHLGKAILIGFSESLKNNSERFERMKDVILETTPDRKKDEIKSITL